VTAQHDLLVLARRAHREIGAADREPAADLRDQHKLPDGTGTTGPADLGAREEALRLAGASPPVGPMADKKPRDWSQEKGGAAGRKVKGCYSHGTYFLEDPQEKWPVERFSKPPRFLRISGAFLKQKLSTMDAGITR